jgi:signal transduction histidine kinase
MPKVFRTSAFREAGYYTAFFIGSSVLLWAATFWGIGTFFVNKADERIDHDVAIFEKAMASGGRTAVEALIAHEVMADPFEATTYQLFEPDGGRRVGNLGSALPIGILPVAGRSQFDTKSQDEGRDLETHTIRARTFRFSDGSFMLVGRDIDDPLAIREWVGRVIWPVLLLVVVVSASTGWLLSRRMVERVDAMVRASRQIMEGHLEQRLPVGSANDEFDQIARQFNAMLVRIEALMSDVQQVTAGIAHDLRSPLTRLRVRLEKAVLEQQADVGFYDELIADVDGMCATFDAMLRIAEVNARDPRSRFRSVDLGHLVEQVDELYRAVAEDRGLAWEVRIDDRLTVQGDEQLIAQSLSNLVDNALKYTPTDGRVSVRLRHVADRAELSVEDTGPGIPFSARSSVLKHFFRLEESRTTPGNGLGLALVAAVANFHAAELVLEDACPGLRVRLSFPNT